MKVGILTTGDELMTGELVDTNSVWLAAELFRFGLIPTVNMSVGDDSRDLTSALDYLAPLVDHLVVTGGLGPTEDDLTVDTVAAWLGCPVAVEPRALARAMAWFQSRGISFTENNRRQARIPEAGIALENPVGLAPGFRVERGSCTLWFLPGVPREFKAICQDSVLPALTADPGEETFFRCIKLAGAAESHLSQRMNGLMRANPDVRFGFRAHSSEVWFKILVKGPGGGARLDEMTRVVHQEFGSQILGHDEDTMESVVGRLLLERGLTLATAESCTGGLVGGLLTNVPGSSAWYLGGGVTYSNSLKMKLLGVSERTLEEHGAVSEACAREMAEGARRNFGSDLAVAITGIAGPGGGSAEKPEGTVHFALAFPGGTIHKARQFRPGRAEVRGMASWTALNLVRLHLLDN